MEHLGRYLKQELKDRGIYVRQVAKISGSNLKTLYKHLDEDNLTAKELFAISELMGIDLNDLRKKYTNYNKRMQSLEVSHV